MNQFNNEIPKGMSLPEAPELKTPVPLNLGRGNYIAAIYQALQLIPVNIRMLQCRVVEREGLPPEVELTLHILDEKEPDEKEEVECRGAEISD